MVVMAYVEVPMISEDFYKEDLENYIRVTKDEWQQVLSTLRQKAEIPSELQATYDAWVSTENPPESKLVIDLSELDKAAKGSSSSVSVLGIPTASFDAMDKLVSYYDNLDGQERSKEQSIRSEADSERKSRESEHEAKSAEVQQYNDSLIQPLKDKQQELLSYKEDFDKVFLRYDITPMDVVIPDDMSVTQYTEIVDSAIASCKNFESKRFKLLDKVFESLKDETNLTFTFTMLMLLALITYFALPFMSIPIFSIAFLSVHNVYSNMSHLRLASALMSEVNFQRFIPESEFKSVDELSVDDITETMERRLSEEVKDYSEERQQSIAKYQENQLDIENQINNLQSEMSSMFEDTKSFINTNSSKISEMYETARSRCVSFPSVCSKHLYFSRDFVISKTSGSIDITKHLDNMNLVFDASDRDAALNNMKLYLSNLMLNIRVKQIVAEIIDPINLCVDFSEFLMKETKEYIKPNSDTLDKVLDKYRKVTQMNVTTLKGATIDEFNVDAEERELVPKNYAVLLFVSGFEKLFDDSTKKSTEGFLEICNSQGIFCWFLSDKEYKGCTMVRNEVDTSKGDIQYDVELGRSAMTTYTTELGNFKDSGISYKQKFGNKYIPEDKWWTFDTIKGINMPFGLEGGDPDKGLNVAPMLGDANVHAILAGATGAGKSATINQMLVSLITMYPPSELKLVFIDFKNVEAAKFTGGYYPKEKEWMPTEDVERCLKEDIYYDRVSRIPHLEIISGTTDGGYALSVFEYLMNEMKRRQGIINKFGRDQTKIEGVRKCILQDYIDTQRGGKKCTWSEMRRDWEWYKPNVYDVWGDLPRLLVIFDEFQVMYNPEYVDNKTINAINGKITALVKLARAMAAHLWFTSQSMKGTMSKDVLGNFSLRGALRCDDAVSNEILGNPASATITSKFGYMYSNDSAGTNKDANRLWRVPFLDEKDMSPEYIDKLFPLLEKFNETHRMARFYDEKVLVPSDVLLDWYARYPDKFSDQRTFIIGERAEFSTNRAPITVDLQCDTGENILIAASEREDLLNLTHTVLDNIGKKENTTLILNIRDKESNIILGGEDFVAKTFAPWVSPDLDIEVIMSAVEGLVEKRKAMDGPFNPIYITLINWEREAAFGNFKIENRIIAMLKEGPVVGIHFVLSVKEMGSFNRSITNQCQHRLLGLLTSEASKFSDNMKLEKLPTADQKNGLFAFYEFGTKSQKFRIYQHKFKGTVKARGVFIGES